MDDDIKAIAKSTSKAIENVTDIFNKIAGPLANEFGQIIGDRMREYRISKAVALLEKTKRILEVAGIDPNHVPPSLFLPIIENASVQDNDALHDRWAALLANAAKPSCDILPAYIEILKQLSAYEVQFLDSAFDQITEDQKKIAYPASIRENLIDPFPRIMMENIYRLRLVTRDTQEVDPKQLFHMRAGNMPFYFSDLGRAFVVACRPPQIQKTMVLEGD
jgi:hypothetical protein